MAAPVASCFGSMGWNLEGPEGLKNLRKFIIARILLIGIAVLSAAVAATKPADILSMVAWAFSLAAGGQFPALALGIRWKGTTPIGAVLGMLSGFTVTLVYLVGTRYYDMEPWWEISNTASAIFGLPVGLVVTVLVSLVTPASSDEVLDALDNLRLPEMYEGSDAEDKFMATQKEESQDDTNEKRTVELGINTGTKEVPEEFDEPKPAASTSI